MKTLNRLTELKNEIIDVHETKIKFFNNCSEPFAERCLRRPPYTFEVDNKIEPIFWNKLKEKLKSEDEILKVTLSSNERNTTYLISLDGIFYSERMGINDMIYNPNLEYINEKGWSNQFINFCIDSREKHFSLL